MKAIDFACYLLLALEKDSLDSLCQRCLIALAAGLYTAADIAPYVNLQPRRVASLFSKLERVGLVRRDKEIVPNEYHLSDAGKQYIRRILSFLPSGQTNSP